MFNGLWTWLRAHVYIIHVLGHFAERLEALEAAVFHGHAVHAVWVPLDMTPEEAWNRLRSGLPLPVNGDGRRCFVLIDGSGNVLKVVK